MKIAHIADLHIKLRNNSSSGNNIEKHLNNITKIIRDENIDIVIIAGDLFDITPQNEIEQRLVYDFLTNILKINYVKEMVVINGNHDLLHKKQIHSYIDEITALHTYSELLKNTNQQLYNKLIYASEGRVYKSLLDNKLEYNIYSLETPRSQCINDDEKDADVFRIGVYHDILTDYVLEKSLPIRKDILEHKLSIQTFKADNNDVVIAGDIHDNWTDIEEYFYYCGSTNQVNFGEGIYIKIHENQKPSINTGVYEKFMNIYDIDVQNKQFKRIAKKPLNIYDNHFTIDIASTSLGISTIVSEIDDLLSITLFNNFDEACNHWIKVKLPISYKTKEDIVIAAINAVFKKHYKLTSVEIAYTNKSVVDQNFAENITNSLKQVVNEIEEFQPNIGIDEKDYENYVDFDIHSNVQTLTDEQLIKIFKEQIYKFSNNIDKEFPDSDDAYEIHNKIVDIFNDEYNTIQSTLNSKKFDIKLNKVYCNQFMGLGENTINLKIPGIVRILGSNGVGKTTLFTLIRYVIDMKGFDGLKQNQKTRNALLFFNDNLYNVDDQNLSLYFDINNSTVKLYRNFTRVWKNNTTDEQKQSKEWRDYVSTVKMSSKMIIFNKSTEKETIIENVDDIQNMLNLWFKNILDTITFINYSKIRDLINKEPKELKDIILHYIGLEYIDKLKDNLGTVKDSLNIIRPKESLQSLLDEKTLLQEDKNYDDIISEIKENIENTTKSLLEFTRNEALLKNQLETIKKDMVELKALKTKVKEYQSEIDDLFYDNNVELNTEIQYKVFEDKFDEYQKQLDELRNQLNVGSKEYKEKQDKLSEKRYSLEKSKTELIDKYRRILNDELITLNENYNADVTKLKTEKLNIVNDMKIRLQSAIDDLKHTIKNLEKDNTDLRIKIDSSVCHQCNRPFDEDQHSFEKFKIECNNKIIENTEKLSVLNQKLKVYEEKQISLNKPDFTNDKLKAYDDEILNINSLYFRSKALIAEKQQHIEKSFTEHDFTEYQIMLQNIDKIQKAFDLLETNRIAFIEDINTKHHNINTALQLNRSEQQQVTKYNKFVDDVNAIRFKIVDIENQLQSERFKNISIDFYNQINGDIIENTNNINKLKIEINSFNTKLNNVEIEKSLTKQKLTAVEEKIRDYYDYRKKDVVFKIYKDIIEKHLPTAVFMWYQQYINKTLEYLLKDNDFSMYWDIDGNLQMLSTNDEGSTIYRPISLVSGMESTFLGLSLIFTLHSLNIKNQLSHIFIDELSGALSTGENLKIIENQKNRNIDFQTKFVDLLNRFTNKSIFIVDHNISNLFETYEYNVIKTDIGGKFI